MQKSLRSKLSGNVNFPLHFLHYFVQSRNKISMHTSCWYSCKVWYISEGLYLFFNISDNRIRTTMMKKLEMKILYLHYFELPLLFLLFSSRKIKIGTVIFSFQPLVVYCVLFIQSLHFRCYSFPQKRPCSLVRIRSMSHQKRFDW